ncbi:CPBP family intramembrane metalloprotease [Rhodococcus sp. D-46]|uniref:CPBP family glutamic-type intramembrane protease n=1 Tax=Rhodococcus sp. D-46 TaxID=2716265 RepID=UPI0013F69DEE|nr:CPBP family intramembrane metalloprotease [Rhodococcus sp. D-46]
MILLSGWASITAPGVGRYLASARSTGTSAGAETEVANGSSFGFVLLASLSVAAIALVFYLRRRISPEHTLSAQSGLRRAAISAGISLAAVSISRQISGGINSDFLGAPGPTELATASDWYSAGFTLIAGAAEEPFYAALPILLVTFVCLRTRYRIKPWLVAAVIVVSGICRALLHIYQGVPWALDAVFWGSVAVYTYYRYRSLIGLIIGHTLHNATLLGISLDLPVLKWVAIIMTVMAAASLFFLGPTTRCYVADKKKHPEPRQCTAESTNDMPPFEQETLATR